MSKTYKHNPQERAMGRVARIAKKSVRASREALKARKAFNSYMARKAVMEDLLCS